MNLGTALKRLQQAHTASGELETEFGARPQFTIINECLQDVESMLREAGDDNELGAQQFELGAQQFDQYLDLRRQLHVAVYRNDDIEVNRIQTLLNDFARETMKDELDVAPDAGTVEADEHGEPVIVDDIGAGDAAEQNAQMRATNDNVSDAENSRRATDVDATDSEGRAL